MGTPVVVGGRERLAGLGGVLPRRSVRVAAMVAAVLALSLGDLALTLTYVLQVGLIEDNPIARGVLAAAGPAGLVAWKLLTLGLACGVLLGARRTRAGEYGAAIALAVMVWLTWRWVAYIETSAHFSGALCIVEDLSDGAWVTAEPGT